MNLIEVVAALVVGSDGRALMVRKHGTTPFMQPGGKLETGEDPLAGLQRELTEELGLALPADRFTWVGEFSSAAANEPGHVVRATVWRLELGAEHWEAAAEIAEARWIDPAAPDVPLAPLSELELLPLLA